MSEKTYRSFLLEFVIFVSGALVMIYEITGSRLLAPYLGTSIYIWTSLIGVILGSLSVGYWLGGKAADRNRDVKLLSLVLLVSMVLMTLTILAKDRILPAIANLSLGLEFKSFVAALVLFAPVSIPLGFVTPYVTRLRISTLEASGSTVGRLYALSTCGSIMGTFAAEFFLLPFIGSTRILYVIAASLFALALLSAPFSLRKSKAAAAVLMLATVSVTELKIYAYRVRRDVYDFDTPYERVRVLRSIDPRTGRPVRLLMTDPYSAQSIMFMDNDDLVFDYTKYYHLIRYFKPGGRNTLMIGGAGYSFPKEYLRAYPGAKIEVVEIDPGKTLIARKLFRLQEHPDLKIIHEDGRVFLNSVGARKYDAILLDAFNSLLTIPFQLTTLEAVQHMHRALVDDGLVILNLISAFKGEKSKFLAAEHKTFSQVFPRVFVFKVEREAADDVSQNIILLASKTDRIFLDPAHAGPEIADLLAHRYTGELPPAPAVLTDELAPVEYYNSFSRELRR